MIRAFATVDELSALWRKMTMDERGKAAILLGMVSDRIRQYGKLCGKDVDDMAAEDEAYASVLRSVTIDVTARAMATPNDEPPLAQFSQSALGYSISGSYLVPGGGIFIKNAELKLLGLMQQKVGVMEYDFDQGNDCHPV